MILKYIFMSRAECEKVFEATYTVSRHAHLFPIMECNWQMSHEIASVLKKARWWNAEGERCTYMTMRWFIQMK